MVTVFATGKPFRDHSRIIQRNALKSWTLLHPDVEVILFGDDEGASEITQELGIRHEPYVERNQHGTKRLDYMFARAQAIARHDILCYINCDIILLPEFCEALKRVKDRHSQFLMIGRRWDANIAQAVDFSEPGWDGRLRSLAREQGVQRGADAVDFFTFPRGFYEQIPPLVVGRIWWDHWLVWKARRERRDVVDASRLVIAIHQNHDYGYHTTGARGVWEDEQARQSFKCAGGCWHLFTIDDATHILETGGERSNPKRFWAPFWRQLRPKCIPVWFAFLNLTRPLRKLL
jgi:hypothetical protein